MFRSNISPPPSAELCFYTGFLLGLFFYPENEGDVPPKCRLTLNGLHWVISQKMALFVYIVRILLRIIKGVLMWPSTQHYVLLLISIIYTTACPYPCDSGLHECIPSLLICLTNMEWLPTVRNYTSCTDGIKDKYEYNIHTNNHRILATTNNTQ
jgi:hypothetical protein